MTQVEQRRAEANRQLQQQMNAWTRRRVVAWGLMLLGVVIALQHILAHSGWRPLPVSMGWQDILIGYPMGGLLVVAGAMLLDPRPSKP